MLGCDLFTMLHASKQAECNHSEQDCQVEPTEGLSEARLEQLCLAAKILLKDQLACMDAKNDCRH